MARLLFVDETSRLTARAAITTAGRDVRLGGPSSATLLVCPNLPVITILNDVCLSFLYTIFVPCWYTTFVKIKQIANQTSASR